MCYGRLESFSKLVCSLFTRKCKAREHGVFLHQLDQRNNPVAMFPSSLKTLVEETSKFMVGWTIDTTKNFDVFWR